MFTFEFNFLLNMLPYKNKILTIVSQEKNGPTGEKWKRIDLCFLFIYKRDFSAHVNTASKL